MRLLLIRQSVRGTIYPLLMGFRPTRLVVTRLNEPRDVQLLRESPLFDADEYLRLYPDVAASRIDPHVHYVRHGSREGRLSGRGFDRADYLARYPDVAASGMDPLIHYLRHGQATGRWVTPLAASDATGVPAVARSRPPVLRIEQPVVSMTDGKLTISCDMGDAPRLYAVHDGPPDVLARIEPRIEPFLPIALFMAGQARRDLAIEGPADSDFLATLRLHYIPLLQVLFGFQETEIVVGRPGRRRRFAPAGRVSRASEPGLAGLLFSGGIDSFYSLVRLRAIGYPLRLLINVNAGGYCHRECMEQRQERVRRFAYRAGLEPLTIDTNFHEVVDIWHAGAHPFRTLPAAYTAFGGIGGVFHSTGISYQDIRFDWPRGGAGITGAAFSNGIAWARMPVIEIGYEKRRLEKLEVVADEPLSYQALDVCINGEHPPGGEQGAPVNCGECIKCTRTILSLDLLGRLDRYRTQFDLEGYPASRERLLAKTRQHDYPSDRDLLARLRGERLPGSGPVLLGLPLWATSAVPVDDQREAADEVRSRPKASIRLYWWRSESGLPNVGDELSPLIVERVSGRKVEWAPPEACDMAAIGSVAEVLLRANRSAPVHLWGTGFIADGPTLTHAPVEVAAIRGPLSATRLGLGGDVTFGDPGLLADLLLDGPKRKDRAVGIVPHHLELDLPIIEAWRTRPDVVISPHLPVSEFLEAIARCELILSSSLHGLIAADAFGVPNIWVRLSSRVTGNGFKFCDYLSCVGRSEGPHQLPTPEGLIKMQIDDLVNAYRPADVSTIRQRLVDAFPDV